MFGLSGSVLEFELDRVETGFCYSAFVRQQTQISPKMVSKLTCMPRKATVMSTRSVATQGKLESKRGVRSHLLVVSFANMCAWTIRIELPLE